MVGGLAGRHQNEAAREAAAKAEAIENGVYDLKAVNPNRKADVDTRTPAELIDLIEANGAEVSRALAGLRALLGLVE